MGREKRDTGTISYKAAEAIADGSLVKLNNDETVSRADAGEESIGTADNDAFAAGEGVGVNLWSKPGTHVGVASGAFATGAALYGQDGGLIGTSTAGGALRVGTANEPTTAAGDAFEFIAS